MKQKLLGALSLVLCALMLMAPVGAGAKREQTGNFTVANLEIYTHDLITAQTTINKMYSGGEAAVYYWENGVKTVVPMEETSKLYEYSTVTKGRNQLWRCINGAQDIRVNDEEYAILELEKVGPLVNGYPKSGVSSGNEAYQIYMFEGAHAFIGEEHRSQTEYMSAPDVENCFRQAAEARGTEWKIVGIYEVDLMEQKTNGVVSQKYFHSGKPTVDIVFPLSFTDDPGEADIQVLHMTNVDGTIATEDWTLEEDGIHVEVTHFSPFAILYDSSKVQLAGSPSASLPRTGDSSVPVLWAALLLGSAAGWFALLRRRRLRCGN